jgi:hypothetical protein
VHSVPYILFVSVISFALNTSEYEWISGEGESDILLYLFLTFSNDIIYLLLGGRVKTTLFGRHRQTVCNDLNIMTN